jgi:TonB family protein
MDQRKFNKSSIIVSLCLHIALFIFLMMKTEGQKKMTKETAQIEWVDLEPLNEKKDDLKAVQIVEQDDESLNKLKPKKDYKLSKNDQDVIKETKAQKSGEFKNRKSQREGDNKPVATTQERKQNVLENLKPALIDSAYNVSKVIPLPKPALQGSEISQSDEYLKDVVAGAETHLKTREFVYYSYYTRIKGKLRQHWEPRIKEKIVKILRQGRKIASVNDKITRLVITLDQSGELVRIQVRDASGYNDLDDAAIEAFRAAAPFPNPPNGIVNASGVVEINWDFILET